MFQFGGGGNSGGGFNFGSGGGGAASPTRQEAAPAPPPRPMLPIPTTAAEYRELLVGVLTCMDKDQRLVIENTVVKSLYHPPTAFLLVQIINEPAGDPAASAGVRQLAAVLLRKRALSMWRALEYEQQAELKQILLTQMGAEPVRLVRFAIAHVLCVIARVELRDGWPELMQAVNLASESDNADHRELACVLVHSLARALSDATGDGGSQAANVNLQFAGQVLLRGMGDGVWAVRKAAFSAAEALAPMLGGKNNTRMRLIDELVPRGIAVIAECGGADTGGRGGRASEVTKVALQAIHMLEDFVKLHSSRFRHLDGIIATMLNTASAPAAHMRVREEAAEVLSALIVSRPKQIVKRNLLDDVLRLGFALLSETDDIDFQEPRPDEDDEDGEGDEEGFDEFDDDEARAPSVFGGRMLTAAAEGISSKRVVPGILARWEQVVGPAGAHALNASVPVRERKAAVLAAASIATGCSAALRKHVGFVLGGTATMLASDPEPVARAAAAQALVEFAVALQPEILHHHRTLVPLLLGQLADPDETVRTRVARALEGVCDELGPAEVEEHVDAIIPQLVQALGATQSLVAQTHICGTIAAVSQGRSAAMQRFAVPLLQLLLPVTGPGTATALRRKAIETAGVLGASVGSGIFTYEIFTAFYQHVQEAFQGPQAELREACYSFIANMVSVFGREFKAVAPPFVQAAIALLSDQSAAKMKSLNPLAAADFRIGDDDDIDAGAKGPDRDSDEDDDDDDAQAEDLAVLIRPADVEEKCAAVYCLGVLAVGLGADFGPALPGAMHAIEDCIMHVHAQLRINAIHALAECIRCAHAVSIAPQEPQPPAKGVMPTTEEFSDDVRGALDDFVRGELMPIMNTETDAHVVAAACDAVVHLVRHLGAVAIHPYLEDVLETTAALLRKEAPCQNLEDDNEADSNEEDGYGGSPHGPGYGNDNGNDGHDEDHDTVLIDSVSEIVDTLCIAYGASFAPYFHELSGYLLPYTADDRPGEDHIFAVGVIAQCLEALGAEASRPYFQPALQLALRLVRVSPESVARSNCCYILRVLVDQHPGNVAAAADDVLAALWSVLGSDEELQSTLDNAASAACAVVVQLHDRVPVATILAAVLPRVPFLVDKTENPHACRMLEFALQPHVAAQLPAEVVQQLVDAVSRATAAHSDVVSDADKGRVWQAFEAARGSMTLPNPRASA